MEKFTLFRPLKIKDTILQEQGNACGERLKIAATANGALSNYFH
jgi:hypothetical protein